MIFYLPYYHFQISWAKVIFNNNDVLGLLYSSDTNTFCINNNQKKC